MPELFQPHTQPDTAPLDDVVQQAKERTYRNLQQSRKQDPDGNSKVPLEDLFGGNGQTGPDPGFKNPNISSKQKADAINEYLNHADQWASNPGEYSKPYTFNTGVNNADFDRFYNHPAYNKLGYSPFKDNEKNYNENSSWFDDFTRMAGQLPGLVYGGAKSSFYGWGNLLSLTPDKESEAEETRRMSIASSSRPGFGGSAINFAAGTANLVGFIGESFIEGIGVTTGLGMLTATGVGAPAGVEGEIAEGSKIAKNISSIPGRLNKLWESMQTSAATLKALTGVQGSREAWEAAKATAKWVNPLGGTLEHIGIARAGWSADKIKNTALLTNTFGEFYRNLASIRTDLAFAKQSGAGIQNDMTKNLVNEYYAKNGKMPEGTDADKIYNTAKQASTVETLSLIPLFYVQNRIVLDKLFKGFKPLSADIASNEGLIAEKGIYKDAGAGYKKFLDKAYWKQAPSKVLSGSLAYGKANLAMGAAMPLMDAINKGVTDYYTKIYHDPSLAGHKQMQTSMGVGLSDIPTAEGLGSFTSGFIMGGVLQLPQKMLFGELMDSWVKKFQKSPQEFAKWKSDREEAKNKMINSLNDVTKRKGEYASAIEEDFAWQTANSKNEPVGDRKAAEDGANASLFSNMYSLMRHGYGDHLINQLKGLRDLPAKDLADAFGASDVETPHNSPIHERLDKVIARAEHIKNRYNDMMQRFPNPYDPYLYNKEKQPELWNQEYEKHKAFEDAKMHATYSDVSFDNILKRQISILSDMAGKNKPFAKANSDNFTVLLTGDIKNRLKTLSEEIKVYSTGTGEEKKLGEKSTATYEHLETLDKAVKSYNEEVNKSKGEDYKEDTKPAKDLKEAYYKYVHYLGKEAGEHVLDKNIDASFSGFQDYIELKNDAGRMARVVNKLHDPKYLHELANHIYEVKKGFRDIQKKLLKESQDAFQKMTDGQELFNAIGKLGAYLDPSQVDRFLKGEIDLTFRDSAVSGPIDKDTPKYKEIQDLLKAYNELHKKPEVKTSDTTEIKKDTETEKPKKGNIIYGTSGTQKTELAKKYPDKYIDGDEILFNFMKDNGLPITTVQNAGKDFVALGVEKYKELLPEIQQIFRDVADSGKNVLTANWFARGIADKIYLSKDETRLAEVFKERGQENPEEIAKQRIADEARDFKGRKTEDILEGERIEDALKRTEAKEPVIEKAEPDPIEKQIEDIKSVKDLIALEDKIKADPDITSKLDTPEKIHEFEELLKKKREELIKSVTFDDIKKGDYLIMKNKNLFPEKVGLVIKRTKSSINVRPIKGDGSTKISKETIKEHIQNIYSKELPETAVETTISKDAEAISKKNIETVEKIELNADQTKKILDANKDKTKQQVDDEFTNNLGCK